MPNVALIPAAATRVPALMAVVDGFPDTTHKLKLDKSDEPLEDGTSITDHAVTLPEGLVLTGWVSDINGGSRPGQAWQEIRRLNRVKTPLTVVTECGIYRQMLIDEVDGAQAGRGGRFTMQLKEIKRVGNPQRSLPPGGVFGPAFDRTGSVDRGLVILLP